MRKVFMLNNFSENEESPRFSGDIIQNLRRAILAPPEYKKNIQEALQNVDFKFHRRCSYANLIRECNVAEGQTLLIFWGYGTSDSGITIMSASSSTSILMSPGTQGNLPLRSTGQQTDISCGYSSFASPVLVGEAESQRALRERLADSLTYAAPPSPPPAHRSASILGSVCALLLRKQGSSGAGAIAGKEASGARSRQSGSICRICFGGASRERLARPCACRGTVAAVHRSCLERWLLQAATSHCELCRYHYVVTRTHKWSWWRAALAWARGGGARALLADASRGAALAAGALLGTARALRACDAALQAGARRGGLPALAANVFSSLLIGLVGALNGLLTTWMLLKVQEHQAAWRAWRDSTLHVHVTLPDTTPAPSRQLSTRASRASHTSHVSADVSRAPTPTLSQASSEAAPPPPPPPRAHSGTAPPLPLDAPM